MKQYPSPDDIQEMRRRGYDPITIAEAEELLPRWQQLDQLRQKIESAFAGVTLQEGIGLYEAQGIDDYASQAQCLAYRAKDEKLNWHNISINDLNRCNSSLSFFDAQGMLFHLPAFLLASLNGDYLHDLTFRLIHLSVDREKNLAYLMLNSVQLLQIIYNFCWKNQITFTIIRKLWAHSLQAIGLT